MNESKGSKKITIAALCAVIALLLLCIGFIAGRMIAPASPKLPEEPETTPVEITPPAETSPAPESPEPAAQTVIPTAPVPEQIAVHTHTWAEANCVRPCTCTTCGETNGSALGHSWIPATCSFPRTCSACGETEGEALGHTWMPATTQKPKMCSVCGMAEGEPVNPFHTGDRAVDLYTENESNSKVYSVAVAHSQSKSACETCVLRLREAGYNAFLYEQLNKSGYSIQIGAFTDLQEAKDFAEYLHTQSEVKGVSLASAYVPSKTLLPSVAVELYASPWW